MKKILFCSSLVLFAAWLISFLTLNFTPVVHVILLLSILLYLRSVMVVEASPGSVSLNRSGPEQVSGNNR